MFPAPKNTIGNEPLNLRMDSGHSMYRFPFYNSFKNFQSQQTGESVAVFSYVPLVRNGYLLRKCHSKGVCV